MRNTVFIALVCALFACTVHAQDEASPYVGQETREIKSLSSAAIQGYKNGAGMGLAKAAELNGYPGPRHVLDMARELHLSGRQIEQIQQLFDEMKQKAVKTGLQIIEAEELLDSAFIERTIDRDRLYTLTVAIAKLQGQLRAIHLEAHLRCVEVLFDEQVMAYSKLRGYTAKK